MATTTPNFGWSVPTSSDLVKNGATAIETLGDSIDASLVDLKGGTTGQVLTKASGTDMDFTWSAGASVPTSLGFAAGKNKIINGDFNVWQRGTTFTNPSSAYTADRFLCTIDGGSGQTITRQTFTPGTAPVSGYEGTSFLRATMSSGSTFWSVLQKVEDVRAYAGQSVTFSFWAKASSAFTGNVLLRQNFGSGGSSDVDLSTTVSVTTSWQRFTYSTTLGSMSGKTIGTNSSLQIFFYYGSGTIASNNVDTWGWQIEAGSTATAFQTATGTIQGELAACQRYYYNMAVPFMPVTATSSGATVQGVVQFPVTMRIAPTASTNMTNANYDSAGPGAGKWCFNVPGTGNSTKSGTATIAQYTSLTGSSFVSTGATYSPVPIGVNVSSTSYLDFSAEL